MYSIAPELDFTIEDSQNWKMKNKFTCFELNYDNLKENHETETEKQKLVSPNLAPAAAFSGLFLLI